MANNIKFKREKFFDEVRGLWILRCTRKDGSSLQMAFKDEPTGSVEEMNYELISFKLTDYSPNVRFKHANEGPEGFSG